MNCDGLWKWLLVIAIVIWWDIDWVVVLRNVVNCDKKCFELWWKVLWIVMWNVKPCDWEWKKDDSWECDKRVIRKAEPDG